MLLIGYSVIATFGTDGNVTADIFRLILLSLGFSLISILPTFASKAIKNVRDDILNFILFWGAVEENEIVVRDLKWMAESVRLKKPKISLGGYFVLDKSVIISVSAIFLNNTIIILIIFL